MERKMERNSYVTNRVQALGFRGVGIYVTQESTGNEIYYVI